MAITNEQAKQQAAWIREAIPTADANTPEKNALAAIFDEEGFGGAEDFVGSLKDAQRLAADKMEWLRGQVEEGFRSL